MSVLNELLHDGAEAKHPEDFKLLIQAYFSGVRCERENKLKLAEGYFALVKKYGGILQPYFAGDDHALALRTASVTKTAWHAEPRAGPATASGSGQIDNAQKAAAPKAAAPKANAGAASPDPPQLRVASAVTVASLEAPADKRPGQDGPAVQHNVPANGGIPSKAKAPARKRDDTGRPEPAEPAQQGVDTAGAQRDKGIGSSSPVAIDGEPGNGSDQPEAEARLDSRLALDIVGRHIIPKLMRDGILINVADCTLYFFKGGRLKFQLPVVVGRPKSKDGRSWETPLGNFRVTAKVKDPTWHIPPSIQKEMADLGEEARSEIPPGPDNPLGKYAIRTSFPGILIHGTNAPSSKKGYQSHGCIRVPASRIEALYHEVNLDSAGEIIYRPVKIAANEEGQILLEVHKDAYGYVGDLEEKVRATIEGYQLQSLVDWDKVSRIVKEKSGFAEDVSL